MGKKLTVESFDNGTVYSGGSEAKKFGFKSPQKYDLNKHIKNGLDYYATPDDFGYDGSLHKKFTAKVPLVSYKCGVDAVNTSNPRQIATVKEAGIKTSRLAAMAENPAKRAKLAKQLADKIAENTHQ